MSMEFEVQSLLRLALAIVLCGALGWERETIGKAAGLRTHILVGMGSALFVLLAHYLVRDFRDYGDLLQFDPTRVLEAVAAGVSFLGAGTIVFARGSEKVRGLTTAASLWTTGGVGMAVGLGEYVLAIGATVMLLVVLRLLLVIERRAGGEPGQKL